MAKKILCVIVLVLSFVCVLTSCEKEHVHSWSDKEVVKEANCFFDGVMKQTCECGGEQEVKIDRISHEYSSNSDVCSRCGEKRASEGLAFILHSEGYEVSLGVCYDSHVVIPSYYEGKPVYAIAYQGFKDYYWLETIILPETIKYIGDQAFEGCSNLVEITIPKEEISIGYGTFAGCKTLKEVVIPNGVTRIDGSAFEGCSSLESVTIPDTVTAIGADAFKDCTVLKDVKLPTTLTELGWGAFDFCQNITNITIPEGVTIIDDNTFRGCKNLETLKLHDGITEIGDYAFAFCEKVTSMIIPASVTKVGRYAYSGCGGLISAEIPSEIDLGEGAFSECDSLKIVRIGVARIGDSTFSECRNLCEIILEDSVKVIGDNAFMNCVRLTTVYLGKGLTDIGDDAFDGCKNLSSVYYSGTSQDLNFIVNYGLSCKVKCDTKQPTYDIHSKYN